MSFLDVESADERPSVSEFYIAGLAASFIVFFACLALFSAAALFGDSGSLTTAVSILLVGGFWGAFITGLLAFMVIAPFGTAIGFALARFASPGYWQGPANGAATAVVVLGLYALASSSHVGRWDLTGIALAAGFVTIAATAGWMVQRWLLRWPGQSGDNV